MKDPKARTEYIFTRWAGVFRRLARGPEPERELYVQRIESPVVEPIASEQIDAAAQGFVEIRTMSKEEFRRQYPPKESEEL